MIATIMHMIQPNIDNLKNSLRIIIWQIKCIACISSWNVQLNKFIFIIQNGTKTKKRLIDGNGNVKLNKTQVDCVVIW